MFQNVDHVSRYYDADAMFAFVDGGKAREIHLGRWNPNESEEYNLAHATYPLLHYGSNGDHISASQFFLPEKWCLCTSEEHRTLLHFASTMDSEGRHQRLSSLYQCQQLDFVGSLDDLVDLARKTAPAINHENRGSRLRT